MGRLRRTPLDPAAYYLLLAAALGLAFFGLTMVFSAGTGIGLTRVQDTFFFARRQALWLLIGLVLMLVASKLSYRRLDALPGRAWWVAVALLAAVWIPGLGWTVNGATRWIRVFGFTVQPSEVAKLVVLVCVAQAVSRIAASDLSLSSLAQPFTRWVLVPLVLVILQRDMGTAVILLAGPLVVFFVAGLRGRDLAALGSGVVGLAVALIVSEPFRIRRIFAFLDPRADPQGAGYQTLQSFFAFASGGLFGVGLGAGRQKFLYLPAAHTDFIFAVIGEELGLVGALAVVFGFVVLVFAGVRIALRAEDTFGRLLAGGIVGTIGVQAVLNMFAVVGLAPVTGVPLPLVSFGGWALMMAMAGIGLVLAVGAPPPRLEAECEDSDLRRGDGGARVPRSRPALRVVRPSRTV